MPPVPAARVPTGNASYHRRQPEHSLLHRLVEAELPALREAVAAASDHGAGLPRHVEAELTAFLRCGLLEHGFARVLCRSCRTEHRVALSCKGRGLCATITRGNPERVPAPSRDGWRPAKPCAAHASTARRMHDTAAHLVDRVLPHAPYRQWVVTFPSRVRWHLAADPRLATEALREVTRTLFAWQRRGARSLGVNPGRANSTGAITFVQRFNSALELSLHFHLLLPDAVFLVDHGDARRRPRLVVIEPPTQGDVDRLLRTLITRITALLQRRGRLDDELDEQAY